METTEPKPIILYRENFKRMKTDLRKKKFRDIGEMYWATSNVLKMTGVEESAIMRTQSLLSFLEHCEDTDANPLECFLMVLEIYLTEQCLIKEEASPAEENNEEKTLTEKLKEAMRRGNRDEVLALALLLIEKQAKIIKEFQRKDLA